MKRERLPVAIGQFGRLVSLGLWAVLSEDRGLHIVGNNFDYDELIQLITEPRAPAAVILDAAWAQTVALRRLREAAPTVGLLALIQGHNRLSAARLLDEGVTECLSIDAAPDDIRAAVRRAANSTSKTPITAPQRGHRTLSLDEIARLTPREREVLECACRQPFALGHRCDATHRRSDGRHARQEHLSKAGCKQSLRSTRPRATAAMRPCR